MENKRIGVITLYDYNFGSALQAFATQSIVENLGYECEIICEKNSSNRIAGYVKRLFNLSKLIICNPFEIKNITKTLFTNTAKSLKISPESEKLIHEFCCILLNLNVYTYHNLKKRAKEKRYKGFFCGSDQIWNGAILEDLNLRFLRFAPYEKRIAWAPSFGGNKIAVYNEKRFKKYISEIKHLSVREQSGADLIKKIIEKKAPILCDPVMLFTAEGWREKYQLYSKVLNPHDYILAFFIDEPTDAAISYIIQYLKNHEISIISFGYQYTKLRKISGLVYYDGNPFDFISLIDHARIVLTDSFHATIFSVIFHTQFYVFRRQYQHNQNQSVRVTDFLKAVSLEKCFEAKESMAELSFERADQYIIEKREKTLKYLSGILQINKGTAPLSAKATEPYVSKALCCGCGACMSRCPKDAIKMEKKADGHFYPWINMEQCISCNLCRTVCQYNHPYLNLKLRKNVYVAAGKDQSLIAKSASGGIFAILAKFIISQGGIVFGAALCHEENYHIVKHIGVEHIEDLVLLQGSKYVQSETSHIFDVVYEQLKTGRMVMFSGTSCQVAALKSYLSKQYTNLLTVDLICHGVPSNQFLNDYISNLERKFNKQVKNFNFRKRDGGIPYVFTFTFTDESSIQIPLRSSSFYRIFMSYLGYRDACYYCQYATIDKPGDITLGDFLLSKQEMQKLNINRDDFESKYLSCVISHSDYGEKTIEKIQDECVIQQVPMDIAIQKHEQLRHPSVPKNKGLWDLYLQKGFQAVDRRIHINNIVRWLPANLRNRFSHKD